MTRKAYMAIRPASTVTRIWTRIIRSLTAHPRLDQLRVAAGYHRPEHAHPITDCDVRGGGGGGTQGGRGFEEADEVAVSLRPRRQP